MNERIDHSNYEAWLLDRLEGNLTPDQERELDAFLVVHPELSTAEDELPTVAALTDALSGADKASLKRALPPVGAVNDASVDDHLIARLEGDLDAEQEVALRMYLAANPQWQHAEKVYALTKLVPEAMAYAAKHELERQLPPQGMPTRFTIGDFLIARLEGDLTHEQAVVVDRLVAADEALQRSWVLLRATRTAPEPVVFGAKHELKKKEGRVIAFALRSWTVRLAAAASVAALIAIGLWFMRSPEGIEQRFARVPGPATEKPVLSAPEKESGVDHEQQQLAGPLEVTRSPGRTSEDDRPAAATPVGRNMPPSGPVNTPAPLDPAEEPTLAQAPSAPPVKASEPTPLPEAGEQDTQLAHAGAAPAGAAETDTNSERTLGEMLAGTLRERVLDTPAREARPLDGADAVAAVDRTLKAVGGERAGLAVDRKGNGGVSGFSLRLGRNFAISASR